MHSPRFASPSLFALLLASLASAACSSSSTSPIACSARSECPRDAFCRAGACERGGAPTARIAALDAAMPRANQLITFDASESGDPDAEDQLVTFAWSTAPVAAECLAQPVAANAGRYSVIVPCAGTFRVELTVTDSTGMSSSPAVVELRVAPDDVPPPAVVAGADLALDHLCSGEPLTCSTITAGGERSFALSAQASGGRGPLQLSWTVAAPAGVRLEPDVVRWSDGGSASPVVSLRTPGPIAGVWEFTVLAQDSDGRAAKAVQRVTVGNRPPAVTTTLAPISVGHRYDALAGAYTAEAPLPYAKAVDPDGDPVSLRIVGETAGDGGHGVLVDGASLRIRIPAAEPQHLIGEGVERKLVVIAEDGNGPATRMEAPIVVQNRPPRIASARGVATVPHRYDPTSRTYTASAMLSDYVDDDGDPLLPGTATELAMRGCSTLVMSGPTLTVQCSVPLTTVAALATLAGSHVLDVDVRDPWASSPAAQARVEVTNAPPRVALASARLWSTLSLNPSVCCKTLLSLCTGYASYWQETSAMFLPVEDPDGDPLDVTYGSSSAHVQLSGTSFAGCVREACAISVKVPASPSYCTSPIPEPGSLQIDVSDGAASAASTVPVTRAM